MLIRHSCIIGTTFWSCEIDGSTLDGWQAAFSQGEEAKEAGKTPSGLSIPRRNPYVAKSFTLHPFPADNGLHKLVGKPYCQRYSFPSATKNFIPWFVIVLKRFEL